MDLLSERDRDARAGSTDSIGSAVLIMVLVGLPGGQFPELVPVRLHHSADVNTVPHGVANFIWQDAVG